MDLMGMNTELFLKGQSDQFECVKVLEKSFSGVFLILFETLKQ